MWYLIVSIPDLCTLTYVEDVKAFRIFGFALEVHSNTGEQKAKKMYSED